MMRASWPSSRRRCRGISGACAAAASASASITGSLTEQERTTVGCAEDIHARSSTADGDIDSSSTSKVCSPRLANGGLGPG